MLRVSKFATYGWIYHLENWITETHRQARFIGFLHLATVLMTRVDNQSTLRDGWFEARGWWTQNHIVWRFVQTLSSSNSTVARATNWQTLHVIRIAKNVLKSDAALCYNNAHTCCKLIYNMHLSICYISVESGSGVLDQYSAYELRIHQRCKLFQLH